jgi:hypothetical protein
MSEQPDNQREPADSMARQSGAVVEDLQPVASSDRPDQAAGDRVTDDTIEPPTDPGRPSLGRP